MTPADRAALARILEEIGEALQSQYNPLKMEQIGREVMEKAREFSKQEMNDEKLEV